MPLTGLSKLALSLDSAAAFTREGVLAPVPLFTPGQCQYIRSHLKWGEIQKPPLWEKARFATDRPLYDLAVRPSLLALLQHLIGDNIVLWGASVLMRQPGDVHPWHTDIESSAANGHFVSVWVGIQNSERASSLKLISHSHLIGKSFQQVAAEKGYRRGAATDEMVLAWAREGDARAALVHPDVKDGDAIVFDGRLWHGSFHAGKGQRIALLFQYATADSAVSMPDLSQLEWPFRNKPESVPVVLVNGSGSTTVNRIVEPPEPDSNQIRVEAHPLKLPLPEDPVRHWRPHHFFRGATPNTQFISTHVSVLSAGHSPHPPHSHGEEELLIVLDGEAEVVISKTRDDTEPRAERLRKGSFAFYPAYQHHTIRNSTTKPINYLMFKWRGAPAEIKAPLETTVVHLLPTTTPAPSPFSANTLLEGATNYLAKLHSHRTVLQPGAGYANHADDHDVAIIVLAGRVKSVGRTIGPCGVFFYSAGELHDMYNVGEIPASYLVFEFHAP